MILLLLADAYTRLTDRLAESRLVSQEYYDKYLRESIG